MSQIVLHAAIAAGTGTGATFNAYDLTGPLAVFRESGATGVPALLNLKRTEPKATKDYAGAARGEVRFTRQYADTLGRNWPAVLVCSTSIPAFLTDAQKVAFVTEGLLALLDAASQDCLAKLLVPQS